MSRDRKGGAALREQLEREFGVPHDHPKAERLFSLALEAGHAGAGFPDTRRHYGEMAQLLDLPAPAGPVRYAVTRWGHAGESDEHWSLWLEGADEWDPELQRIGHIEAAATLNALKNLSDRDALELGRIVRDVVHAEIGKVQEILT